MYILIGNCYFLVTKFFTNDMHKIRQELNDSKVYCSIMKKYCQGDFQLL